MTLLCLKIHPLDIAQICRFHLGISHSLTCQRREDPADLERELLDFTQSDMGWDFDFSTIDCEAFFSVYQSNDAPTF